MYLLSPISPLSGTSHSRGVLSRPLDPTRTRHRASAVPRMARPMNPVVAKLQANPETPRRGLYGAFLMGASPTLAELLACVGYDFLVVDMVRLGLPPAPPGR